MHAGSQWKAYTAEWHGCLLQLENQERTSGGIVPRSRPIAEAAGGHRVMNTKEELEFALRHGPTLCGGRRHAEDFIRRDTIEQILRTEYPVADTTTIDSFIVPFAYCWHLVCCAGRNHNYNHKYPVSRLRSVIAACFGLRIDDLPVQALLAALHADLCQTKLIRHSDPKDWIAKITSKAVPGDARKPAVYLCELGRPGALPPIEIMYP